MQGLERHTITTALVHLCAILSFPPETAKSHLPHFDANYFETCNQLLIEKGWLACVQHYYNSCSIPQSGVNSSHPFLCGNHDEPNMNWIGIEASSPFLLDNIVFAAAYMHRNPEKATHHFLDSSPLQRLSTLSSFQSRQVPSTIPAELSFGRNSNFTLQSGLLELDTSLQLDTLQSGKHRFASFFVSANDTQQRRITIQHRQRQFDETTEIQYNDSNEIVFFQVKRYAAVRQSIPR